MKRTPRALRSALLLSLAFAGSYGCQMKVVEDATPDSAVSVLDATIDVQNDVVLFDALTGDDLGASASDLGLDVSLDATLDATVDPPATQKSVFIAAHQDDDLLFMNPDIQARIQANEPVLAIFLTAGDAGRDRSYWEQREQGIFKAYAQMANAPDQWQRSTKAYAGHQIQHAALNGKNVEALFLRLPDGNPNGTGYPSTGQQSLENLWERDLSLDSIDGAERYTRMELIEVLRAILGEFGATSYGTTDSTGLHTNDHSDHFHAALFAFEAIRVHAGADSNYSVYQGYGTSNRPVNLSAAIQDEKWSTFTTYAKFDDALCLRTQECSHLLDGAYKQWSDRQYGVKGKAGYRGTLVGLGGKCVTRDLDGTIVYRTCGPDRQDWDWDTLGRLEQDGMCISAPSTDNGTDLEAKPCTDAFEQRWVLFENGQIRGVDGKCIDLEGPSFTDGTPIQIWKCVEVPQQLWNRP